MPTNTDKNYSNYPEPCQKYLINDINVSPLPVNRSNSSIKSIDTDNRFGDQASKCGNSIVSVGKQIVLEKTLVDYSCPEDSNDKPRKKVLNNFFTGAFSNYGEPRCWSIFCNISAKRDEYIDNFMENSSKDKDVPSTVAIEKPNMPVYTVKPCELREMNFWSPTST